MRIHNFKISLYIVTIATLVLLTGCSSKDVKSDIIVSECIIDGIKAPIWVCGVYEDKNAYMAVGMAQMSKAGEGFTRREAMADARSNLSQQIETKVKDKVEVFMRSTGVGSSEVVDKVTTQVSKQVAKETLIGSKQISYWRHNAVKNVYVLASISKSNVNKQAKKDVINSFKHDDALWQQFQAKKALIGLEKEFYSK